mmetsp:Transcript_18030/g.72244  ORF Transcript_18030/g.72244 Transcript_18030/m.72244 type:complete len:199 (-) Transcript_18030:236-832(-)
MAVVATGIRSVLRAYGNVSEANPWSTAFAVCTVKGAIADGLAQTVIEHHAVDEIDVKRNALFAFYGGWYCGWAQHFVYNIVYTRLFGTSTSALNAVRKVAFDSVVHVPFGVFPVYYAYKGLLYDGLGVVGGLRKYADEARDMIARYYMVWVPANLVTFTVVPTRFRITFIATTSLGWLTLSSFFTHGGLGKSASSSEE